MKTQTTIAHRRSPSESTMQNPSLTISALGTFLMLGMLGGCDAGASGSDQPTSTEHEPSAELDPVELKAFNASPRLIACEESAQCARGAAGKDEPAASCRDAVQRCLRELAGRTSPAITLLGDCRESARTCLADEGDPAACSAEFRTCVKGTLEGAAR